MLSISPHALQKDLLKVLILVQKIRWYFKTFKFWIW